MSKVGKFDAYIQDKGMENLREEAEKLVAKTGYSSDSPCYDLCVEGAMREIAEKHEQQSKGS